MLNSSSLPQAFAKCKDITEFHAKSFAFAAKKLPPDLAQDVYAVYAFCRITDDLVDEQKEKTAEEIETDLNSWKQDFHQALETKTSSHPVLLAFVDVLNRRPISASLADELIAGVSMDIEKTDQPQRFETFKDVETYCYYVAGVPGLMMAQLFGITNKDVLNQAVLLGKAMQITNILRDIADDQTRNRLYLATEDLHQFGVSEADLAAQKITPELKQLMKHYIAIARTWYKQAQPGIGFLPSQIQVSIYSASRIYEKILTQIEKKQYDIFSGRVFTSKLSKIRSFVRIYLTHKLTYKPKK